MILFYLKADIDQYINSISDETWEANQFLANPKSEFFQQLSQKAKDIINNTGGEMGKSRLANLDDLPSDPYHFLRAIGENDSILEPVLRIIDPTLLEIINVTEIINIWLSAMKKFSG